MSRGEKSMKKVKIKTQNEKTVEADNGTKHKKKQLLESGRNSHM